MASLRELEASRREIVQRHARADADNHQVIAERHRSRTAHLSPERVRVLTSKTAIDKMLGEIDRVAPPKTPRQGTLFKARK